MSTPSPRPQCTLVRRGGCLPVLLYDPFVAKLVGCRGIHPPGLAGAYLRAAVAVYTICGCSTGGWCAAAAAGSRWVVSFVPVLEHVFVLFVFFLFLFCFFFCCLILKPLGRR